MRIDFHVDRSAHGLNWLENATACSLYRSECSHQRCNHICPGMLWAAAPSRPVCLIIMDRFWKRIILTVDAVPFAPSCCVMHRARHSPRFLFPSLPLSLLLIDPFRTLLRAGVINAGLLIFRFVHRREGQTTRQAAITSLSARSIARES